MNDVLLWAIGLGGGAAILLAFYYLLPYIIPKLKEEKVWEAVKPYFVSAIMKAYQFSEQAVDQGQERLRGMDKHQLAVIMCGWLPERLEVGPLVIQPQKLFPPSKCEVLIAKVFKEFDELLDEAQEDFEGEFMEWLSSIG